MDTRDGGSSLYKDENTLESGGGRHQSHHHPFSSVVVKSFLLFGGVVLICIVFYQSTYATQFFQRTSLFSGVGNGSINGKLSTSCEDNKVQENVTSSSNVTIHEDNLGSTTYRPSSAGDGGNLGRILKSAAMEDGKTVIITTLNAAWTEPNSIFDLFLEGFRIGNQTERLLKHVVVAAFDQTAYARCLELHLHCYALTTDGVDFSGEAHFMSEDYLKMMWRRIDFLHTVLQLGYDFVFTDADVMWLRDPFQKFYPDGDFQIACDHYWYTPTDVDNSPNGGFNYVKANNRTIKFYKFWHTGKDYFPGKHDQDVLNFIKSAPFVKQIGLEMRFLDTAFFGGFCEPSKDLDLVITMHANCCIGLENKIHDIKMVIDDWKRYVSLPREERNMSIRSWTVPRICG